MSTRYPASLPEVPPDRWNAEMTRAGVFHDDGAYVVSVYAVDAATAEQAEQRVLAWIDRDYEDDLRGAVATAAGVLPGGRMAVSLRLVGPF